VNKIMHTPITTLKSAAKDTEATTVIDVVRRIFNLKEQKEQNEKDGNRTGFEDPGEPGEKY